MSEVQYSKHTIPVDILDEIAARFIVNLNQEERKNFVRICFQVEEAHWFYIDFYVNKQPHRKLQGGTMRTFTEHIFRHVPFLQEHVDKVEQILEEWRTYKLSVPTYGAIIINTFLDKVLLVQGFWARTSWGFPKGKINQDEEPHICAAREVYEETGYDISDRMNPNCFLERYLNDQTVRLYIVSGVQEDTAFKPIARCEIKDIRWFDINTLPINKGDQNCKDKTGYNTNSFYMVIPFAREIKAFVQDKLWQRLQFQDNDDFRDKKSRSAKKSVRDDRKTPQQQNVGGRERSKVTPARQDCKNSSTKFRSPDSLFKPVHQQNSKLKKQNSESAKKSTGKVTRRQLFEAGRQPSSVSRESSTTPQDNKSPSTQPVNQSQSSSKKSKIQFQPIKEHPANQTSNQLASQPSNSSRAQAPTNSLIPDGYCPKSWTNFSLDTESLLLCFTDLPASLGAKKRSNYTNQHQQNLQQQQQHQQQQVQRKRSNNNKR